ncbi:glycine--tRNA ligase subunit beta [Candidatus Tisiphia endosymbiont of Hybos culiciformis]|uniref:glycine--tRNA ligase subunit beta n=1 Tax=Candidatus Tisiphia endosymbiont of Hybos culiciformis TaxID=3139331 RepID=UPI003CCAAB3D
MSELLLEIFSEEIPALMQKNAAEAYKTIFTTILQESELVADVQLYVGSRRIAVHITNLPKFIPPKEITIRGPKVSATQQAIEGFCRSNNIRLPAKVACAEGFEGDAERRTAAYSSVREDSSTASTYKSPAEVEFCRKSIEQNKLSKVLVQGQLYYIIVKSTTETDIRELLQEIIPKAISKYIWSKSMYWGNYDISWIRPLRNILCIFDGKTLAIKYGHLTANNITFGHRFLSPELITIDSFSEYQNKLRESNVIIDQEERKEMIKSQLSKIAKSLNLVIKDDEKLLEEVTGLVELPMVMVGKIPEIFLQLPSEVLVSSMRTHQKYFSTFDQAGNFAPYFLFVSNMPDDQNIIVSGNEKVLAARLSDALYFYQQDLSNSLESKLPKLAQITFHAKLGSIKQKTERMADICNYLMPGNQDLQLAARLCKSDLTTEMVGEFPELQGIMGYYYAKAEGLDDQIALAIRDHYKPQGLSDSLPMGNSAILAIADKLDSLVGLILIGEEPSGSRDPYSLRRQALGIIRIILANKLTINIKQLVVYVIQLYSEENITYNKSNQIVLGFLEERAKYYFKNHYDLSLINAVIDFDIEGDLVITEIKLCALQKFLAGVDGENLLTIYKRANNILEGSNIEGEVDQNAFISQYEQQLFLSLGNVSKEIDRYIAEKDFTKALSVLLEMLKPINDFFDNLMVKDKDRTIANNRLLLLRMVTQLFDKLARFSAL